MGVIKFFNITLRDKENKPLVYIDNITGILEPLRQNNKYVLSYKTKLNKIIDGDKPINFKKYTDKENFMRVCESLYDSGEVNIYADFGLINNKSDLTDEFWYDCNYPMD